MVISTTAELRRLDPFNKGNRKGSIDGHNIVQYSGMPQTLSLSIGQTLNVCFQRSQYWVCFSCRVSYRLHRALIMYTLIHEIGFRFVNAYVNVCFT